MPETYPQDIDDLANAVVKNYYPHRFQWTDISLNFPQYLYAEKLLNKARSVTHKFGTQIVWKLKVRNIAAFRKAGLFDENTPARNDVFIEANTDFVSHTTGTFWDVKEKIFNRGPVQIVDHLKGLMHAMHSEWFEQMEHRLFTNPTDTTDFLGFPHTIVKSATAAFGFNGGNPASGAGSSTGSHGVNSSTYSRWANGTGTYSAIDDTFLDLVQEAIDKTEFKAPYAFSSTTSETPSYSFITTYPVVQGMRTLTRVQNDNIGRDLAKYRGRVVFGGVEVIWSPSLTYPTLADGTANPAVDTANPFYGINWNTFFLAQPDTANPEMTGPKVAPTQRHVREVYMDIWHQLYCVDRRKNFVLQQAA